MIISAQTSCHSSSPLTLCGALSDRLTLLDLSLNPGLHWDPVQWMGLLASLRALTHLDIRNTGRL